MKPELYSSGIPVIYSVRYVLDSTSKNPIHDNTLITNRLMPEFKHHTYEMTKIADLLSWIHKKAIISYEHIAKEEYEQGGGNQHYPNVLK